MTDATIRSLKGTVSKLYASHSRKASDGNYGSVGAEAGIEFQPAPDQNIDEVFAVLDAYAKARVDFAMVKDGEKQYEAVSVDAMTVVTAQVYRDAILAAKPEPVRVPDGDGVAEVTEFPVAKYTIAIRPDGRHQLQLFPRIKDAPGKFPEVTFVGDEGATAEMISAVVQDVPKVPSQGLVAWTGFYRLGREYVSSKDQKTRRYKDLVAVRMA